MHTSLAVQVSNVHSCGEYLMKIHPATAPRPLYTIHGIALQTAHLKISFKGPKHDSHYHHFLSKINVSNQKSEVEKNKSMNNLPITRPP